MPTLRTIKEYLPLAGGITGAILARRGAGQAQGALTGGVMRAQDMIRNTGQQVQSTLNPYLGVGERALPKLERPSTPFERNPDFSFSAADLYNDPGYQFRRNEAEKVVRRGANADLSRFSGATLKAMQDRLADVASQEYDRAYGRAENTFGQNYGRAEGTFRANEADAYQRIRDAVDVGQTAAAQQVASQRMTGQQLAELETELANAQAEGDVAKANIITDAIEQGMGFFSGRDMLKGITGAAGAVGAAAPTMGAIAGGAVPATAGTFGGAAIGGASLPGYGLSSASLAGAGGSSAGAGAGGVSGALGLGGGSGLFGLGAATIPVIGGAVVGGALLAKKLIGRGRRTANTLTGPGGLQRNFEEDLRAVDQMAELDESQKWQAKQTLYRQLAEDLIAFAGQGSQQRRVAGQAFNTISPLFGERNPLVG